MHKIYFPTFSVQNLWLKKAVLFYILDLCNILQTLSPLMQKPFYNLELHLLLLGATPPFLPKRSKVDIVGTVYHLVIYMQSNKIPKVF